jgi:hypothetical protein
VVAAGEGDIQREDVQRLRSELMAVSAHAGLVIGPVDVTRDARSESQTLGQPLVTLLCGDAFAEEIVMRHVGVVSYEATAVDDSFWRDLRKLPRGESAAERGRQRSPASGTSPPSAAAPQALGEHPEGEREAVPLVPSGGEVEVAPFELEASPDIDQFLNETIPPKPPDAVPLQQTTSEEGSDGTEAPGEPQG